MEQTADGRTLVCRQPRFLEGRARFLTPSIAWHKVDWLKDAKNPPFWQCWPTNVFQRAEVRHQSDVLKLRATP
jgi:hypothetical protein